MKEEDMQKLYIILQGVSNTKELSGYIRNYNVPLSLNKPHEHAVTNPTHALFYYAVAFTISDSVVKETQRVKWQHYWLKCCLSEKCDYVFTILGSIKIAVLDCKGTVISREKNLVDIITNDKIWESSTSETKRYYSLLAMNFLLRRYNWLEAARLYKQISPKSLNFLNLFFPRIISAILLGYLAITTSNNIWTFASTNQSKLIPYSILMLLICFLYLLFECSSKNQWILTKKTLASRVGFVFSYGLLISFLFSIIFLKIGLFDPESFSQRLKEWCPNKIIFYSVLAYFIGIIVQLLWEDKTVTEPF